MYWTTGSGRIELNITKQIAAICSHQGNCDNDVNYVINNMPKVKKQLDAIPAELLASELSEYGAWDEIELQDNEANKQRILWIAAGDILEGR